MPERITIGTAGWSIPRALADHFGGEGSHLQRYARVLRGVEINSSFYRPHKPAVYAKWAAATPCGFQFAVKVPRSITHDHKLRRARQPLAQFLDESSSLAETLGPLLVQLPPSLAFDSRVANGFFDLLRSSYHGPVVCEPRHPTWFAPAADRLLVRHRVARAAADPPPASGADQPGGWSGLVYFRLHGSPRKYWSRYDAGFVARMAGALQGVPPTVPAWCIFDNTASGAALENALDLQTLMAAATARPSTQSP